MMFRNFFVLIIISLSFLNISHAARLKTISSENVATFIKANEFLLVIFVERDCNPCKDAEGVLSQLASEMMDSLMDVTYVKVIDNAIPRKYGIDATPVIIFYRHQRPVIYDGAIEVAAIEDWITFNKEVSMKILNDDTFEHLTQAAAGATTGDWLVLFCNPQVESCNNLEAVFETVASKLRGQRNVAFVDIATSPALVRRFSLSEDISIRLFRLGKMYTFSLDKLDVESLVLFVQGWYKNMKADNVPLAPSPFDSLVNVGADIFKKNPWMWWAVPLGGIAIFIGAIVGGRKNKHVKKN